MKLSVRLSPSQRHSEFPITRRKVYLAHAAESALPARVSQAVQEYAQQNAVQGQWEYLYAYREGQAREYAARLIGCDAGEIAFTGNTSTGLSTVAAGLPWTCGDNVVIADGDFPANVYPWLNLRRLGVATKFVEIHRDGLVRLEDVARAVDRHTRLVSLSSVNFATGARANLDEIGAFLHEQGILFCVDAVQSLGALPFNAEHVDFAAASAHKWLLGPLGIGILYVKREHFARLEPVMVGWKTVQHNKQYLDYRLEYADSARRYEAGSPNVLGLMGLHAALGLLLEVGTQDIALRIHQLRRLLIGMLTEAGFEVVTPRGELQASGIVSFTSQHEDMAALRQHLDRHNIVVSLRETLDGRACIRVAPHFYNNEDDLQALLDEIKAYQRQARVSLPAAVTG